MQNVCAVTSYQTTLPLQQNSFEFASNAAYTALAWIGLFELNTFLFDELVVNQNVSWLFLPAAVRVLAVLVSGYAGVVGLFFGALYTNLPIDSVNLIDALALTALTALNPFLAVWLLIRCFGLKADLSGLRWWHLIAFAAAGAVSNVTATQLYLAQSLQRQSSSGSWWPMLVGDLVGTAIVLYAASFLARFVATLYGRR